VFRGFLHVDLLGRIAGVLILAAVPAWIAMVLAARAADSRTRLAADRALIEAAARSPEQHATTQGVLELTKRYNDLVGRAEGFVIDQERFGWVSMVGPLVLALLAALAAVGQYQRHNRVLRMRVAFDFLRSPEGIAWLQAARKGGGAAPPTSPPPPGA
jgi:hypothetical protein